ncbi:hypothetical protein [Parvularcula oceani]|uniref:hypothetical protein n=1 Tax=Parvularcula oceani TaxID=1247963 RepID=UPI00068FFB74|nr:hypothetical protein [Parvularcula oceani]
MKHAVFYHWKIKSGREQDFEAAWEQVTKDGKERCGAHGATLHKCDDGSYAAYALWPDKESREKCWLGPESQRDEAKQLQDCVETELAEVLMDVKTDLLDG